MTRLRYAAWLLAALTAWSGVLLTRRVLQGEGPETSLLALLPSDTRQPLAEEAVRRMAEAGARHAILLVRGRDLEEAGRAADACAAVLRSRRSIARALSRLEGDFAGQARDFFLPWRYSRLTPTQRERLRREPDAAWLSGALERLYAPIGPPRLIPLESDPFGLFSEALLEAASRSGLGVEDQRLIVRFDGGVFVAVLVELAGERSSTGREAALLGDFADAVAAARRTGATEVLRSCPPGAEGDVLHWAGLPAGHRPASVCGPAFHQAAGRDRSLHCGGLCGGAGPDPAAVRTPASADPRVWNKPHRRGGGLRSPICFRLC